jgi:hypothetical protein
VAGEGCCGPGTVLETKTICVASVENKILTWENLQNRGWQGPGMCYLCRQQRETNNHIFVNCVLLHCVWSEIKKVVKAQSWMDSNSLVECFHNWNSQNSHYQALPAFTCWNIWMDRNKALFEDIDPSVQRVVYTVMGAVGMKSNYYKSFKTQDYYSSSC